MAHTLLAEAAMAVHFAYVVCGGFLAWRRPRAVWPHLAAAAYGLGVTVIGWPCPLTRLENQARTAAGQQSLDPGGFISHYLTGVVYPAEHLREIQLAAAATVALSWLGAALLARRRTAHRSPSTPRPAATTEKQDRPHV